MHVSREPPRGRPRPTFLAAALGEAEQTEEARAQHVQLLQELQQEYGPEHPYPARVELNLGLDLVELERFAEARQHLEHARLALMRTYGEIHLWVAKAELTLSQLDLAEGAVQSAVAGAESPRGIRRAGPSRSHRTHHGARPALGRLLGGRS
ncbi:tetratricopeptide repeat protein [Nannocystis pusilla]|uniref:tetratricopeptide repeat protein n=1 Tax=Nannocystis pusilla TaxID=889268 RepID=UPI003B7938A7